MMIIVSPLPNLLDDSSAMETFQQLHRHQSFYRNPLLLKRVSY